MIKVDRTIVEELYKAERAPRDLDALVARALGWQQLKMQIEGVIISSMWHQPDGKIVDHLPCFTNSLDAATQVADGLGYNWGVSKFGHVWVNMGNGDAQTYTFFHPTGNPALALCILCLSAPDSGKTIAVIKP